MTLAARPGMSQLAQNNPTLLARIARLNHLDGTLYGAAQVGWLAVVRLAV